MPNMETNQSDPQRAPEGAYIYIRVSTGRQVLGTGLETQERDCRAYAQREGWSILRVFREEGESAKTAKRTELQEMLRMCHSATQRPSYVLIHALDRFARNGIDHDALREELLKVGIKLRCVLTPLGETPYDRYIERVLSGLPQLDNELRGERSLAGMKMRVEQGRWTFKAPIGYINGRDDQGNKTLLIDPKRAGFVKEAFEQYATGLYTKEQVRERTNALGLQSANGNPMAAETFDRMLRNPRYAGILSVHGWDVSAKGNFPPLVSIEIFQRVQDVLAGRRVSITPRKRNNPDFPLRNFVRCGHCQRPLTASWSKGKMGVKYAYYRCQNRKCNSPVNVGRQSLEDAFIEFLRQQQPDAGYLKLFHRVVLDVWNAKQDDAIVLVRKFEKQVDEVKERRRKLNDAFVYQQVITREDYEQMLAGLKDELAAAELNLSQARVDEIEVEKVLDFAENLLLNTSGAWQRCSLQQKQRLQQVLFPRDVEYADGVYRTQETSFLFTGLSAAETENGRFGSATGNRTRV